jgi:hypothetical protein
MHQHYISKIYITMNRFIPPGVLLVVLALVVGFFALAIVDQSYREPFADLTKVAVGGYLAMLLPTSN